MALFRRVAVSAVVSLALGMAGCRFISERPAVQAQLTAHAVSSTKAVFDARGSVAERYDWDFGDGTVVEDGSAVVAYRYAEPGTYVVILTVWGPPRSGAGADPGPGPTPNPPVGDMAQDSTFAVVDLGEKDKPSALIVCMDLSGRPATRFWSSTVVFYAGASRAYCDGGLWYLWDIVRVDPATKEPIPYHWASEPEHIRSQSETFSTWMPGPPCDGRTHPPYTYRVWLKVTDRLGRSTEAVLYIEVT